ncbi:hypothetical protein [Paenibacillus xylanexedens]|nr:hypothetical protein [Paenibacillus xylanexedens]
MIKYGLRGGKRFVKKDVEEIVVGEEGEERYVECLGYVELKGGRGDEVS